MHPSSRRPCAPPPSPPAVPVRTPDEVWHTIPQGSRRQVIEDLRGANSWPNGCSSRAPHVSAQRIDAGRIVSPCRNHDCGGGTRQVWRAASPTNSWSGPRLGVGRNLG